MSPLYLRESIGKHAPERAARDSATKSTWTLRMLQHYFGKRPRWCATKSHDVTNIILGWDLAEKSVATRKRRVPGLETGHSSVEGPQRVTQETFVFKIFATIWAFVNPRKITSCRLVEKALGWIGGASHMHRLRVHSNRGWSPKNTHAKRIKCNAPRVRPRTIHYRISKRKKYFTACCTRRSTVKVHSSESTQGSRLSTEDKFRLQAAVYAIK